jgi:hypothetical protein
MGYDDLGYDELGYDDLGALVARRPIRRPPPRPMPRPVARNPAPRGMPLVEAFEDKRGEGTGSQLRDFPMPLTGGTFTSAVTALTLTAQPQRYFIGKRMVIDLGRNGATSTGLVQVTNVTVGIDPQMVNTGSIPASAFAATAVGTGINFKAARAGDIVTLQLSLTGALTAPDTIVVSACIFGLALD